MIRVILFALLLSVVAHAGESVRLPLAIDYTQLPTDIERPEILTALLLRVAVDLRYGQKMPREDSRRWAAILDQLYAEPEELELSKADLDWLRETVKQADYAPAFASWRWTLERHLEGVGSEN